MSDREAAIILKEVGRAKTVFIGAMNRESSDEERFLNKKDDFERVLEVALDTLGELDSLLTLGSMALGFGGDDYHKRLIMKCINVAGDSEELGGFRVILDSSYFQTHSKNRGLIFSAWVDMEESAEKLWAIYYSILKECRENGLKSIPQLPYIAEKAALKTLRSSGEDGKSNKFTIETLKKNIVRLVKHIRERG